MVRQRRSKNVIEFTPRCEQLTHALEATKALAEYARAQNLTQADELLTEVLVLLMAGRSS